MSCGCSSTRTRPAASARIGTRAAPASADPSAPVPDVSIRMVDLNNAPALDTSTPVREPTASSYLDFTEGATVTAPAPSLASALLAFARWFR